MMSNKTIMMHPTVNPFALTTVRQYRGYTQTKLCKSIKGLSQSNLSKFEKGCLGALSLSKLQEIMDFFEWPFDFLYKDIKPVNASYKL